MNIIDVSEQISFLREIGGDTWNIEAKRASDGYPETLDETLSAFANMPEGGLILLGVSELDGRVEVTGVNDPAALMGTLGQKARERITPPIQLGAVETHVIEGQNVIACVVPPQAPEQRPYRVGKNGPAFIRSADGDYELSESEVRVMLAHQAPPRFDVQPVEGADVENDIDETLLQQYLHEQLQALPPLRSLTREDLLIKTNVVDRDTGQPTIAALYALGIYPQQYLPTLSVKARVIPGRGEEAEFRVRNQEEFVGPVSFQLESTMNWLIRNMGTSVVFDEHTGHGRDHHELPLVALREIVANALVHRDLSAASQSSYINVIKKPDQLIVTNPGGLWGLSVRQLGTTSPSARNPVLYRMCRSVRTADGNRVVETAASGIPTVKRLLSEAQLPEPKFRDRVISFEVEMSSVSLFSGEDLEWLASVPQLSQLSVSQRVALVALRKEKRLTNAGFRAEFPTMDSTEARRQLQELVQYGLADTVGERGGTVYVLPGSDESKKAPGEQETLFEPPPRRLSADEKNRLVVTALTAARGAMSKAQLLDATQLSEGQINPTLQLLRRDGRIEFTEPDRSPNQRYRLVGGGVDKQD